MIPIGLEYIVASELIAGSHPAQVASEHPSAFVFQEDSVLGTRLKLLVNARSQDEALAAALRGRLEIDRLDRILNWRIDASELSRLNMSKSLVVSPDLFAVIAAGEKWMQISNGAYSGRLGRVAKLWRSARSTPPDRDMLRSLAQAAASAEVELDPGTRTVARPEPVQFDLDSLAKGYVVDRAIAAVLGSPAVDGALLDIGGDIRCAGSAPGGYGWVVGLPDPLLPYDNAPIVGWMSLRDRAIATSGCGPRDRLIAGKRFSPTLDARTGWPIPHKRSVTAVAATASDADALATALLNLSPLDGADLVRSLGDVSARLAGPNDSEWISGVQAKAQDAPSGWVPVQARSENQSKSNGAAWHDRWVALVTFTAPPRQKKRDRAFRSPYVAIWIADAENRPVRTLVLIGSIKEWQEDNYIWWGQHRASAMDLVNTRSMSTRGTGEYKLLWDGVDENGEPVPPGEYVLHIETSRERGRHTHRSLELDFSQAKKFSAEIPTSEEAGGLVVSFEKF